MKNREQSRRILIATVTAGGGHLQAAAALEEAWKSLRPDDEVEKLDLLDFVSRLHRKLYAEGFIKFVEHAPDLWAMLFKKTDNPSLVEKLARFRRALAGGTNARFVRHLKDFAPEVVLCTHYLPLEVLGFLRSKGAITPPFTVSVVTDFEAHALWMESCVDLYCVAAESTRARLLARGVADGNAVATGIPIAAKFTLPVKPREVRKQYGLRDDVPVLLVLGGGFGMGPVAEILDQLNRFTEPVQVVVVAGRNDDLRRELAVRDTRHPTHVLGFVTNMHELMAAADLVITKPGGLTSSEALAMGKPMLIVNPIPGQEAANSDFLLQHGAAAKINRVEDLPFRLGEMLDARKLKGLGRVARSLGQPKAAMNVCREVMARL